MFIIDDNTCYLHNTFPLTVYGLILFFIPKKGRNLRYSKVHTACDRYIEHARWRNSVVVHSACGI